MSRAESRTHLWQPLGPETVLRGGVRGATRISGRVSSLAVHPDGERVYAGCANGGVWYSGDGGSNWRSLDGFEATPAPQTIDRPAHRFACGAIAVRFGTGAAARDTVIVGTGEAWHSYGSTAERERDGQPGRPFGGVGILIGTHDTSTSATTWVREAANLLGAGVYRIALEPGGARIVAATSSGLYERPASNAEAAWPRVTGAPFAALEAACTDVLWTPAEGTVPPRLWAWVETGNNAGLWFRATNDANATWQRLQTPGATSRRAVLASATAQQVWLFCDHPAQATRGGQGSGTAHTPRAAPANADVSAPTPRLEDDCGCWFRSSDDVRQGFVRSIETGDLRPVTYNVIGGTAIFEGDIVLGTEAEMERLRAAVETAGTGGPPGGAPRGVVITGDRFRWPGGIVPWESTAALRTRVEQAMAHWESRTRIRFVERTPANSAFYPNWVSFEAIDGCSSDVGMQGGGKQVISLVDGCGFGATVHEIGHALGLWHEQSREDRNAHVRVVAANIKPGKEHNFTQNITDGDDVGAYDYASIMHYARDAFSSNGEDTIVALGGQKIGQRDGLSAGDVAAINSIYPNLVRPLLFRVTAAADPVARPVIDVPDVLGTSGYRSIAFAVHPVQHQHVVFGGSRHAFRGRTDDAGLLAADVTVNGSSMLAVDQPLVPGMIGAGVHADVHDIVYSNGGNRLWVAGDGGVYRSDGGDSPDGFVPLNDGRTVIEANYVACHPVCEGRVVVGAERHGALTRRTGTAWQREGAGSGGGVAFDPAQPTRYLHQVERGRWRSSDDVFSLRLPVGEDDATHSAEHSVPALVTKQRPAAPAGRQTITQAIVGTSRLWYTEDFGNTWVTLPGAVAPPAGNLDHDNFGRRILACRWQGTEVAWVLGEGRLRRFARKADSDATAGPGTWSAETILERTVKPKKDETKANGPIRDAAHWTDIAVNLGPPPSPSEPPAVRGTRGALYLGTTGKPGNADVDTLWWFDGGERWFATGLRRHAVPAPVTAVACDPAFPDEVYVGTTIGVWKGVRTLTDPAAPSWTWSSRLNGLPEAVVHDLAVFSRDGLRLLRAGLGARGVWELRLDVEDVADLAYLRAHDDDLRHRSSASMLGRDGVAQRSWHASPDLRARRAALAVPTPATLPWTQSSPLLETEPLRRFQSALRARTGDRRVRPTGQWDDVFNEVMRSHGASTVPPGTVRLDQAFWEQSMQVPWAVAEPWGEARPSSADLLEFTADLPERARTTASCDLPPGPSKVDVLVQHRGLAPMDGAQVRVALLKWVDPQTPPTSRYDDVDTWPAGDVPWTDAINQVLNSAGGTTGATLGSGWSLVGTRQTLTGQTLNALHPGVASFDLDLTGVPDDRVVLLAAVLRAGNDVALAPATLENLVLTNANVAVRSVRITGASVAAPAVRNPFPTVPYALQLSASSVENARLTSAFTTVRATLDAANRDALDEAALIVLRLTPSGTMNYAGVHETDMFFSASLLKVAMLYASFELEAQVNALAPVLTATSPAKFLDRVSREFSATIERSVRRVRPGVWRTTSFKQALTATSSGPNTFRVALSPTHETHVGKIFSEQNQNTSPRDTIHRLGYSYLNRALEAAGFLDAETGVGIWTTADYGDWPDFHVPVSTRSRGRTPKNGTSSAAMTAIAMASLLAHLHRGQLVDATASQRMRTMFAAGAPWSWFGQVSDAASFSFTVTGCKIGHASSGSAFVGSVLSEAAYLRRNSDGAPFLAVWQNVPDALGFEPIYRVIDEMVRTWP